jgi:hypothetical protein
MNVSIRAWAKESVFRKKKSRTVDELMEISRKVTGIVPLGFPVTFRKNIAVRPRNEV